MKNAWNEISDTKDREAIDDYFECMSFCSIDETTNDCETVCMEKFLKGQYF
ncbi:MULTISPECIES: hypothetical protein [Prochlorococcus]|uniref:hypothetical protein n=1 Tax=Prochlorococcus TaxID=1218 RepID=UPI0005337829|nr:MULTISPECIES: hypothetical protein [Prochlorococcus]KGG12733.1 hypothetical protein EV05_1951 [Prochlorococcus sp. MIT 0601]